MIAVLWEKVSSGEPLSAHDASFIVSLEGHELIELFAAATRIRQRYRQKNVDLCAIINAKSGACSEDCSYCAQSFRSTAAIPVYDLMSEEVILANAREARKAGVKRFCIVTGGRKAVKRDLRQIAAMVCKIRETGLLPCATLGLLKKDELRMLKESGLERYHHNLETSRDFFPAVCSTHTYSDKLHTIEAAQSVGLSVCSGGLFGMGESWQDRIDIGFALKELRVDSVPINFLIPVKGTRMENMQTLDPFEALKIVSLYRFLLPEKEIRICGGRRQTLGEFNSMVFMAGADALLTGNYLTTIGTPYDDDLELLRRYGLKVG